MWCGALLQTKYYMSIDTLLSTINSFHIIDLFFVYNIFLFTCFRLVLIYAVMCAKSRTTCRVDWARRRPTKMKRKKVKGALLIYSVKKLFNDRQCQDGKFWILPRTHKEIRWKLLPTVHSSRFFRGCQDYRWDISENEGCRWISVKLLLQHCFKCWGLFSNK